jgi:cell division protein FtsI (penicillin-binding protein 3)
MNPSEKWVLIRIRLVGICFIIAFTMIGVRAFQLQILSQDEMEKRAERQRQRIIPLTPQRGTIYDRNGEEVAVSVEVDSIFVDPSKVSDPPRVAKALASALSLPYSEVAKKIESQRSFTWIKRQVSLREAAAVRELRLPGVGFTKEHRRYYPNSEIGAQVIGFTGLDPGGLEGVELQYNAIILGEGGYLVTERDALGRGLGAGNPVLNARRGSNLYLTLDKNLQYIAEKELAAGVRKAGAKAGTVVVLDPRSGAVLAMASQPDFNPNAIQNHRPHQWRNRAICDTFEPGSTFKPFVIAAALNENVIGADDKIHCENGSFRIGGRTINDNRRYGKLSVTEILKVSSNIGVAKIGKELERERYHAYIQAFGFGRPTGVRLPGEVGGLVRRPSQWFDIDLAAISFGQGISVTPLQLAAATAAIANGGYLMAPYVVKRIVDEFGQTTNLEPTLVRQVISEKVAMQVRDMMVAATEEGGTGTLAAVPGFRIAGKTGTAQKVDPVTGGYSVDKRVASFSGFIPAEDPRLVILVVIDEPTGTTYGGVVAAPVFSHIASQALRYLDVTPTHPLPHRAMPPLPEVAALPVATIAAEERPGEDVLRMPDFIGMSYRQVLQMMERSGINIRLEGSGRVVEQSPRAGQAVQFGTEVWVRFSTPS